MRRLSWRPGRRIPFGCLSSLIKEPLKMFSCTKYFEVKNSLSSGVDEQSLKEFPSVEEMTADVLWIAVPNREDVQEGHFLKCRSTKFYMLGRGTDQHSHPSTRTTTSLPLAQRRC
ncbi:hypothetical protein GCK32_006753, partial [Trichostrongylus colubriformis]